MVRAPRLRSGRTIMYMQWACAGENERVETMARKSGITGLYEHENGCARIVQHVSGSLYQVTPITGGHVHTDHVRYARGHGRARTYVGQLRVHGYAKAGE